MDTHSVEQSDPRRLETVMRAENFVTLFSKASWKQVFLRIILEALGRSFGTEILLRVPENLRETPVAKFRNLPIIEKLRKADIIKESGFFPNLPDEPPLHRAYAQGKGRGSGASFFEPEKALWSALGECVERSLWFSSSEWYEGSVKKSTYKDLKAKKIDFQSLAGFSHAQKENPLFLIKENSIFGWIKAKDWISGEKTLVPLQLLSAEYSRTHQKTPAQPENPEPLLRPSVTTGLATSSKTLEQAVLYGTLEAIERDAFMITWLNRLSPPRIDLAHLSTQDEELTKVLASLKHYHLRTELLLLPTDLPFPVVAGILIDETGKGPAFAIGAKAHWDLKRAILGALSEAVSVRYSLKDNYKQEVDVNKIGRKERLIYWAQPHRLSKISFLTEGIIEKVTVSTPQTSEKKVWKRLCEAIKEKKYSLYASDISSIRTRKMGFHSAYVLVPELQPMHLDERAPALGGQRLSDVPRKLGYTPAETLNVEPHPFP